MNFVATSSGSPLIGDDEPGSAITSVDSEVRDQAQQTARRAVKRINVAALLFAPEVIFDQDFHANLTLRHKHIINDGSVCSAKGREFIRNTRLISSFIVAFHSLCENPDKPRDNRRREWARDTSFFAGMLSQA